MDSDNKDTARLTKIQDVKFWAQIVIEEGELIKTQFNKDKDAFENFSEAIIVSNDKEYVWPFMELSMMVLVAHTQRDLDDIVEAFIFKELHDLAY